MLTATSVPSGAATTQLKGRPGRVFSALVTTAGAGTGNVQITDGVGGLVIGLIPATISVTGTPLSFGTPHGMPAATSIQVVNVANGPVLTVCWD